jgi:uncharacterized protein (DUF302 family)
LRQGIILALLSASLAFASGAQAELKPFHKDDIRVTYKVKANFVDVRDQVRESIAGKGIKINNVSHIGEMLIRTGKDLGFKKKVFDHAQAFEFCSATHSRYTMEADPQNIVFCPYIISVYEIHGEPGQIYVSYRRPNIIGDEASKKSLRGVEKLIDSIVQDALSWFV